MEICGVLLIKSPMNCATSVAFVLKMETKFVDKYGKNVSSLTNRE